MEINEHLSWCVTTHGVRRNGKGELVRLVLNIPADGRPKLLASGKIKNIFLLRGGNIHPGYHVPRGFHIIFFFHLASHDILVLLIMFSQVVYNLFTIY